MIYGEFKGEKIMLKVQKNLTPDFKTQHIFLVGKSPKKPCPILG